MKNQFKEIKQALEYGHMVEVRDLKSKQYCVCSFIQDDGNIVIMSAWRSKKEEAYDLLGYSLLEKYEVDELDLEIKIIPHIYKPLPVGSLVDIIDCEELREVAKPWDIRAKNMIGKKGLNFNAHENTAFGDSYKIGDYHFPAWAITPHIYKELPVGSLVDIIDCEELREMFEDLEGGARDMIGGKGYAMYKYYNDRVGQCYEIQNKDNMIYRFPAWAITPHIEEEKRETVVISDLKDWNDTKEFYRDEYEEAIKDLKEVI